MHWPVYLRKGYVPGKLTDEDKLGYDPEKVYKNHHTRKWSIYIAMLKIYVLYITMCSTLLVWIFSQPFLIEEG